MCQHKAPHREWEPALAPPGPRSRTATIPEPPTLFDDYSGRGKAEHDQDMTIAKTMNDRDLKLVAAARLTPEQRKAWDAYYEPRNEAFRKANLQGKDLVRWKYQRYMHDYLGCIKAVDESVGRLLKSSTTKGSPTTPSWSTRPTRASTSASTAGSTSAGSSRSRCARRCWSAGRAWSSRQRQHRPSSRTSTSPRPSSTRPGCRSRRRCKGRSLVPLLKGQTPADWRRRFYYHYYEYPGPHNVRPHYGVVTDRYKLVHFYEPDINDWELFDLETDPQELRSVYYEPAYRPVLNDMRYRLDQLRTEFKVPAEPPKEAFGNKPLQ